MFDFCFSSYTLSTTISEHALYLLLQSSFSHWNEQTHSGWSISPTKGCLYVDALTNSEVIALIICGLCNNVRASEIVNHPGSKGQDFFGYVWLVRCCNGILITYIT